MLYSIKAKLCVLLAAYNGERFISDQIQSIIHQDMKSWHLFINIDFSSDKTLEIVKQFCKSDHRISLYGHSQRFGAAGKNFYHLLKEIPLQDYQYVAFSDQDDIWHREKLSAGIGILDNGDYVGYSSSVTAVYPDGKRVEIKKSQPQTLIDYKFESAGPGCTYIFRSELGLKVRSHLLNHTELEEKFYFHDWLVYYTARNEGLKWFIDSNSYMDYRQHLDNDTGANLGSQAMIKRLKLFRSGWYFDQVYLLEELLSKCHSLEQRFGARHGHRLRWLFNFMGLRRSPIHSLILLTCILLRIVK